MLIERRPARDPAVVALATAQQAELAAAEGEDWIEFALHGDLDYLLGTVDAVPVACGALQSLGDGVGEIKRMYVVPGRRGRGLSRQILTALEELARDKGFRELRLETGPHLLAAVGLYTGGGYRPIPLFGQYIGSAGSICFGKAL